MVKGRFAGRKVIILKANDEGTKEHPFPHALVCGIDKYPKKTTPEMSEKKIKRNKNIKTFVKVINYNHLMPTRYSLDGAEPLRQGVTQALEGGMNEPSQRREAKKLVRQTLQERHEVCFFFFFFFFFFAHLPLIFIIIARPFSFLGFLFWIMLANYF